MLLLQNLASVSALLAVVAEATTFSYGNPAVEYESRIQGSDTPATTDIKNNYEIAAAEQAYTRITKAVDATGIGKSCVNSTDSVQARATTSDLRNAVYSLKDCIVASTNTSIFFSLLASDISEAETFWKTVVSESNSNMSDWKAARSYSRAYFNGSLTAIGFAGWTLSPNADAANLHANPEHYYKSTPSNATDTSSEILEGWGGVLSTFGMQRTHFKVPSYAQPKFDGSDYPASWALGADFLPVLQRAGEKQLASDGTTFGVLHIAVRDLAANETLNGLGGIEVYSAVWYPAWEKASKEDAAEFDNYLQDEAEHMVVEVVNLTLKSREDLESSS